MLKVKIGWTLMILGVSTANSEYIIVPLALMSVGLWCIKGAVEW